MRSPFFENYSPKQEEHSAIYVAPDSVSLLLLAIESGEPEVLWMIHEQGLTTTLDIERAWTLVSTPNWKAQALKRATPAGPKRDSQKLHEIRQLLMTFGGFTPPPTPKAEAETNSPKIHKKQNSAPFPEALAQTNSSSRGKSRSRGRGRGRGK